MQALKTRTDAEGAAHHECLPVRIYEEDGLQIVRIRHAREFVKKALSRTWFPPEGKASIFEMGCGTADITGPFSETHHVRGMDVNREAVICARRRFPRGIFEVGDILSVEPYPVDVLILCETLEHINDPNALLSRWLPLARHAIISHPIDGDLQGDMSGGDHVWSYNQADFDGWPAVGGHKYLETFGFQMGCYHVQFGLTERT